MMGEEVTLLNKLGEIPVLNDGWSTAAGYYFRLREYNALMRLTLSMAETSVKVAGQMSTPVLNHYQPQITNINDYACKKLDELESKYPIIKQPTEQWKETCTDLAEPVFVRVKPVFTQVQGIVDNGKQKIVRLKEDGTNKIEEAKRLGVGTITHVFNSTFETAPGRLVTRTVDGALNMAEGLVDKYLPEEKSNMNEEESKSDGEDSDNDHKVEEMQEMDPTPQRVIVHAGCVTQKIRKRLFSIAMKDLTYAKARTASALSRMQSTVHLIDYAKENLGTAKDKVEQMWTDIVKEEDTAEEKTLFAGTIENRIIALGRTVALQVRNGVTAFERASSELGKFGRNPISKSREYKELLQTFLTIESIQNFSSQSLAKASASLRFIQTQIQNIVSGSASMDWMAVDIDMDNIPLQENDLGLEQVISSNNNSEDEMEREENH